MPDTNSTGTPSKATDWLAYTVVGLTFAIIIALSVLILTIFGDKSDQQLDRAKYVFGAVLPMLGTWMGTVLAHYFQKENLAAAA